jgi:hypothetical protein
VDEVKLSRALERFGDVKVFGYFGIDGGICECFLRLDIIPRHCCVGSHAGG